MKSWLRDKNKEIYSIQNVRKSFFAERFIIRTLKKIDEYMTSVSENVYIDKLDYIVKKYNNTCRTIKMKPANFTTG